MQAAQRVSSRLASKQRVSWHGGVPSHERPLASAADAQPAQLADELEQAAGLSASADQAASADQPASAGQPELFDKGHPAASRKRTRPTRPVGVEQMTDSDSEHEGGMQQADVAPVNTDSAATQDNRPAPAAGCDPQAAPNFVGTDTDEEDCLAGIHARFGQPSSHGAAEASTSGLPDSITTQQAAGAQQQQGRRRLRTAGGKVVGAKRPKAARHDSAGKKAAGRGDSAAAGQLNNSTRSPFSFDRTPADSDVGDSGSDHAAPTRTARLNDMHKKQIADNSRAARRKSTIQQYDVYIKRLEWFLKYHGGEVPGIAAGTLRDKPYSDDLLQPEAPLATLFLEWVGENFPGWPTKTNKLGVSVLETAHAALSSL